MPFKVILDGRVFVLGFSVNIPYISVTLRKLVCEECMFLLVPCLTPFFSFIIAVPIKYFLFSCGFNWKSLIGEAILLRGLCYQGFNG